MEKKLSHANQQNRIPNAQKVMHGRVTCNEKTQYQIFCSTKRSCYVDGNKINAVSTWKHQQSMNEVAMEQRDSIKTWSSPQAAQVHVDVNTWPREFRNFNQNDMKSYFSTFSSPHHLPNCYKYVVGTIG